MKNVKGVSFWIIDVDNDDLLEIKLLKLPVFNEIKITKVIYIDIIPDKVPIIRLLRARFEYI